MDDKTISISISENEQEFIDGQIAEGRYADEKEVLRAGLASLERAARLRELSRLVAEGDVDSAVALRSRLTASEESGQSIRLVPDIIESVKAKLRANGSL